MFEHAVLDYKSQKRSKWSWMGIVVQAGVVTGILLLPMVSPEVLTVLLPNHLVYVPLTPVEVPVEVPVQPAAESSAASRPDSAHAFAARPAVRTFTAPRSYNNAVANIIDNDSFAPPAFTFGNPVVSAHSTVGVSAPTAPPPPPPVPEPAKVPIRVGGNVQSANILSRVNPPYPPLAKQARISGLVRLEGIITKDGTVQRLRVISGHPLLVPAAVDAVKLWRYRPTHLNGEPVEVIAPIDVHFTLSN